MPPTGGVAARAADPGRVPRGGTSIRFTRSIRIFAIFFVLLSAVVGTPAVASTGDPSGMEQDRVEKISKTARAGQGDVAPNGLSAVEGAFAADVGTDDVGSARKPAKFSAAILANRRRASALDSSTMLLREIYSCEDLDKGRTFVGGAVYVGADIICTEPHVIQVREKEDLFVVSDRVGLRIRGVRFHVGKDATMSFDVQTLVLEAVEGASTSRELLTVEADGYLRMFAEQMRSLPEGGIKEDRHSLVRVHKRGYFDVDACVEYTATSLTAAGSGSVKHSASSGEPTAEMAITQDFGSGISMNETPPLETPVLETPHHRHEEQQQQ
ncbi:unnamed protein product, partial [Scytosiphon promiscuus]